MLKKLTAVMLMLILACAACDTLAYQTGDDYPIEYFVPEKDSFLECWNFYNRECTSFAAWCLVSRNGIEFSNQYSIRADGTDAYSAQWGNASTWGNQAESLGYTVDRNPAVGSIYWSKWGTWGHVAWVSGVKEEEDGDIHVWAEQYNGNNDGLFSTFDFLMSDPAYSHIRFIHIADISEPVITSYANPWDGEVYIRSAAFSDRTQGYLSADGNSNVWGANVGVSPFDDQKKLIFSTVQLDNKKNGVMIRPCYSDLAIGSDGKIVNPNGRRVVDWANVKLYGNDAYTYWYRGHWFSANKWMLEPAGSYYIIRSKNNPFRVLTVADSNVIMRPYSGGKDQLWEILPGDQDPTKVIVYGINYFINSGKVYDAPEDALQEQIASEHKHRFEDYTIRTEIPTRKGYEFLGWSRDEWAAEPEEQFAPGSLYTEDAPLNLFAVWRPISESEGGSITFGRWEQDGDLSNGPEPLTWHVLYAEGGAEYVLCDRAIEIRQFGGGLQNWERSSLRSWLNGEFWQNAFSDDEKPYIVKREQLNLGNDFWVASDDRETSDLVFLPSQRELLRFLPDPESRRVRPTEYARSSGGLSADAEFIPWWIRTNGVFIGQAMQVAADGSILEDGVYGGDSAGIRPVIWLSGRPNSDDAGGGGGGEGW